ncbi:uncharacterized protein LOC115963814 isoform X2 [Quercus lobata]|uniref:uncharacterized protein LOC115963814 isoform X2 n=1 Tax=Quercus lobata TaxID=97700 RepID=UPI001247CA36|nr:uncharacterized protein LOC115963814 isoform X2 [Quercus lobata]
MIAPIWKTMSSPRSTIFHLLSYRIAGSQIGLISKTKTKSGSWQEVSFGKIIELMTTVAKALQKIANLMTTDAKALQFLYVFSNAGQLVRF